MRSWTLRPGSLRERGRPRRNLKGYRDGERRFARGHRVPGVEGFFLDSGADHALGRLPPHDQWFRSAGLLEVVKIGRKVLVEVGEVLRFEAIHRSRNLG